MNGSERRARLAQRPRTRAWAKAVSWRIWALVVLGVLGWIITGSAVQTTSIALIYNAIQIPAFYVHERWWERHRDRDAVAGRQAG
ncbi:MAG TPA: DUF2061 domain-containing protein [Acidimicrobiia bacterium]|jgi:uncharacterized membrane protein|nr:DUF2061 domain-containing protein [Acidimicrobiia bacterium]